MDNKSKKKLQMANRWIRFIILIVFLIFITAIGIMHQFFNINKPASVDALCPFGGIESFYTLVTSGKMLKNIALSSFILLGAILFTALFFRRTFCGNICTLGTLQEIFARIGKLLFKKHFLMPKIIDKPARFLKYLILLLVIIFSAKLGTLVIRPYDPWVAYQHLLGSDLLTDLKFGLIILIISLAGSLFYDRFFCRYICPMGAFLGIINRIGWFRVTRNPSTCINCLTCNKTCPVNIHVQSLEKVNSSECINCNECINSCPVKDTLYLSGPFKSRIPALLMLLISVFIYTGIVGVNTLTGKFQWVQATLTQEVQKAGGKFDASMIKGSMTLNDVAEVSKISKEEFIKEFKITQEDFSVEIKTFKDKYGFDTEKVRDFVKNYLEKKK